MSDSASNGSQRHLEQIDSLVQEFAHRTYPVALPSFEPASFSETLLNQLHSLELDGRRMRKASVVVDLAGGRPTPCVALRVAINTAPEQGHAWKDRLNVLLALGVLAVLKEMIKSFAGSVRLILQPEQVPPAEGVGALNLPDVLNDVQAIYGFQLDATIPFGNVATKAGPLVTSFDTFSINVSRQRSHTRNPREDADPVLVAAKITAALSQLTSRKIDPLKSAVVSVCSIHGGDNDHEVAQRVEIRGNYRTLEKQTHQHLAELIQKTVRGIAGAYGADLQFDLKQGTPPLINDENCTTILTEAVQEILGEQHVFSLTYPKLGTERFAHFLDSIPGCFMFLGTNPTESDSEISSKSREHRIVEIGVKALSWALLKDIMIRY
ncbi:MAG: M20/M25/M40 family metallo-hydrolase [bacterium]